MNSVSKWLDSRKTAHKNQQCQYRSATRNACFEELLPTNPNSKAPDRGSVTAELAVALPAVALLLITILAITAAFGTQMRVSDAARTGARLFALGYSQYEVTNRIESIAGANAVASFSKDITGNWGTIKVRRPMSFGPANLRPVTLTGSAIVWIEP